jgi:hypothetical protein
MNLKNDIDDVIDLLEISLYRLNDKIEKQISKDKTKKALKNINKLENAISCIEELAKEIGG